MSPPRHPDMEALVERLLAQMPTILGMGHANMVVAEVWLAGWRPSDCGSVVALRFARALLATHAALATAERERDEWAEAEQAALARADENRCRAETAEDRATAAEAALRRVERETIERCARVADDNCSIIRAASIGAKIRALSPAPETQP